MGRKLTAHNKCMSRELKGNLSGKTKAQRKKIFAAAARKCSKATKGSSKPKPKSRASPSRRANPTGARRNMTKNTFNMSKIYGLARKGALILPLVNRVMEPGISPQGKLRNIGKDYTGFDMAYGTFSLNDLRRGWEPYIYANIITRVIPKIGSFIAGLLG